MHLKGIDDYNYLSASGCDTVPNMDDVEEFHDVVEQQGNELERLNNVSQEVGSAFRKAEQ